MSLRASYEAFWADAPEDPEPWAFARRAALLRDAVRAGDRVLDLGCGAGRFLAVARAAGAASVVGVELAEEAARRARANAPDAEVVLVEADGVTLPLAHHSADLVWCSEVLEHAADAQGLLGEARRVLAPGGRLLLTVPFHGRLQGALVALTRFERHFDPQGQHLRFYTRSSLGAALAAAGFEAITVAGTGGAPRLHRSLVGRATRS